MIYIGVEDYASRFSTPFVWHVIKNRRYNASADIKVGPSLTTGLQAATAEWAGRMGA